MLDITERDFLRAKHGYERALELAQRSEDPITETIELISLGDTLMHFGRYDIAREYVQQAMDISAHLDDVNMVAIIHSMLAELNRRSGDIPSAIAHYREALRRFEQVQSPNAEDVRAALRDLGAEP